MIKTSEIQTLTVHEDSLNALHEYLSYSQSHQLYQMAFLKYLEIAFELKMYSTVIQLGQKRLNDIKHLEQTQYDEKIIKIVIDAALEIEAFDVARYYIDLRKKYLTILQGYLSLFDEVLYAKKLNLPYIQFLLQLEKENVEDNQQKVDILDQILTFHFQNNNYEAALNYIEKLKAFDLEYQYKGIEYILYLNMENYEQIKENVLKDINRQEINYLHVGYLIKAYTKLGELNKATDLEAQYENEFDKLALNEKKIIFEMIIDLYETLQHKASLDVYKKKYLKIKREIQKQEVAIEKNESNRSTTKQKEIVYLKPFEHEKILSQSLQTKYFEVLNELLIYAFSFPYQMNRRERLRLLLIKAQASIPFQEVVVYLKDEEINFYHYKKERLYDKYLVEHLLLNTWIDEVYKNGDVLIDEPANRRLINVVTQKSFDESVACIYGFPMSKQHVALFHFGEKVTDYGQYYDVLNGLVTIVEMLLKDELKHLSLNEKAQALEGVFQQNVMPVRILKSYESQYNEASQKLLSLDSRTHIDVFYLNIGALDIHQYKQKIAYLRQEKNRSDILEYTYKDLYIREYIYSRAYHDDIELVSFFIDLTHIKEENKSLYYKVSYDENLNIKNLNQFLIDIKQYVNDKVSFCLIELNTDLKSIYGSDLMNAYFHEFAKITNQFFEEGIAYIYEQNQMMVVLPYNDIRHLTKDIKSYLKYIGQYASSIIKDLAYEVYVGVLRYPVVTEEKNISKLRKYFDISIDKAKKSKSFNYEFFMFSDYETEVVEEQLIHQINEAMDQYLLGLSFTQMIDISKKTVWQYEAMLAFDNLDVDIKYLYTIAKKRKRLKALEFYFIDKVCRFLQTLEEKTQKLIKLTIPITKETFLEKTFNEYLFETLKKYQIPPTFIRIKTDAVLKSNRYILKIDELISSGISLDTHDIKMNLMYGFHALHIDFDREIKAFDVYLKHLLELSNSLNLILVVRNVSDAQVRQHLTDLGVHYIEGPLYKKLSESVLIDKIKEASHL